MNANVDRADTPGEDDGGVSLRERHKEVTRDAILSALADIVSSGGMHDFSVQEVADRAGVSHRTVYRHFPTRESLIEQLSEWVEQQLASYGATGAPRDLESLPETARFIFQLFDRHEALIRALAAAHVTTNIRPPSREERTRRFFELFRDTTPTADERTLRNAAMVARCLASSQTWLFLHDHVGASSREAGDAVAWALHTLIDSVNADDQFTERG